VPGDLLTERESFVPRPERGRAFASSRRAGLSDLDAHGRVRLDALARFLQDVAIDDVEETGWGLPEHLWFIRSIRVDVLVPFLDDREVELVTWCSGLAAIAAGRRWSLRGDAGGHAEVESVWIHLGSDERPARIEGFGIYAEATEGRGVSTKLELPDPPVDAERVPWPLRATDIDRHGHVNNAAYWQAVEDRLLRSGWDLTRPLRAQLDYRQPVDLEDDVSVLESKAGSAFALGIVTSTVVNAVARVEPLVAS
jgi:acyl-ACP thioesterase